MKGKPELIALHGDEILPWLDDLARLRIQVFREFPYLYDGTEAYEKKYLQVYAASQHSLIVLVRDHSGSIVGATTALPLVNADSDFQQPFNDSAISPESVFYFGESVLLPEWRGLGIGHRFFDLREEYARELDYSVTAFCAAVRALSHPLKPASYRPHDRFWEGRGYQPQAGICCHFPWKDIDQPKETIKTLQFWLKHWPESPIDRL